MRLGLRERQKRALISGGVVVVLGAWLWFIVGFIGGAAMRQGQEIAQAKDKLKLLQSVTANEALVRTQHEQLAQTVQSLRTVLPAETELPAIVAQLSDFASQATIKIQSIFPQRPAANQPPIGSRSAKGARGQGSLTVYKEIPIQIDAVGGYHELGMFLSLVESSKKLLGLASLRVTGNAQDTKRHTLKMVINSYVAVDDSGSADQPVKRGKPRT